MLPLLPPDRDIETKAVLRKTAAAHRALAEFKGVTSSIPNEAILLETLTLREARESSAIENIISTMDEVYRSNLQRKLFASPAAKEVHHYAEALKQGFRLVKEHDLITANHIKQVQAILEQNQAGFRKLPGTKLMNDLTGEVVYIPPQDPSEIEALMDDLVCFINDDSLTEFDPLIKMAIIHHQFESIHPFYDGNGRTGRILNILYLIRCDLLHLPVLYLSRYIIRHKGEYYRLLQEVRTNGDWEAWLLFMLEGVEETANQGIILVGSIRELMRSQKNRIRTGHPKMYSQDLVDNLFRYPYTKIDYIQESIGVSRNTAIKYLEELVGSGILVKHKFGRENFYENHELFRLLKDGGAKPFG